MSMNDIDVFISYKHETSKPVADAVCHALEDKRIRCWYAPRDAGTGPYARAITNAINSCKVFVVILNTEASDSHHVLNEVEKAYKRVDNGLVIIPFKVDSPKVSDEMEYYINRMNWIDAMTSDLERFIGELVTKVENIVGPTSQKAKASSERRKNDFLGDTPSIEKELSRSMAQARFVNFYLDRIYENITKDLKSFNVLDVGSGGGHQISTSVVIRPELNKVIGMDINEEAIKLSNEKYGSDKIKFYCSDCESREFEDKLLEVMKENDICSFDIINISFLLLFLKDPSKVIMVLKRVLSENGCLIIADIDDGFLIAYPDNNLIFEEAFDILSKYNTSGYRKSGREIYYTLKGADINDISLKHTGLSTIGVPIEVKKDLFQTYFGLIPIVLEEALSIDDNNPYAITDTEWYCKNKKNIEDEFYGKEFMMIAGIIVYVAK